MTDQDRINAHYSPANLAEILIDALLKAGKDPEHLSRDDLAPLDQFHTRGKIATRELTRAATLMPDMRVLDIGGGLGGPARLLAAEFGCLVTVLDLSETYCRVGEMLTRATGQQARVTFRCASALD